jgi:imidazolonepropionase-like amidohydrolase
MIRRIFSLLAVSLLTCISVYAQRTLIHCGTLIDGLSDQPAKRVSIVIKQGDTKIEQVKKGYEKPEANDILIDLSEYTVMPGFIDMHVHLEGETNKNQYLERYTLNDADVAFRSAVFARRTLMAGFTTVRDLGGTGVNIALRNAINQGLTDGPRIFTAGKSLAVTGGHADPTNGNKRVLMGDPGPKEGVVNGVADARKAVRQRYKNGADLIKITATGGVLSQAKNGSGPHFKEDEIAAIVETAKDFDFHVAAHAHGAAGMKRAVRAGVTTIEHGTYMDEETMALMKQHGTYYIPTISAGNFVAEKAAIKGYYPDMVAEKAAVIGPQIEGTFAKAYKYGVPIGFGTDAGVFPHGENAKEFELMVRSGMPAMKAIQAATGVNARILKMADQIGSIRATLEADIVAVKGDPLKDITLLQDVPFVMKAGKVYKNQ